MIISIAGKARAGKDTCANLLVKKFGFKKMNLADPLKTICSKSFDLPINVFYDDDLKDKNFDAPLRITSQHVYNIINNLTERGFEIDSQKELAFFNACVGRDIVSPRVLLQFIGTDVCREIVSPDIWLKVFIDDCNSTDGNIVCADARFPNERDAIKKTGGLSLLVIRPNFEIKTDHVSENLIGDPDNYDVVVTNDRSKGLLEQDIESWWFIRSNRNGRI